ncbi:MAG: secondary thiamine-phosphate synthase enzyme YjbQ [bacterium]|nr:secondary thiamine-phosphate synthase enzyme YjbQ [bacterium]
MLKELHITTGSRTEFVDITDKIRAVVKESGVKDGLCFVFVPHTTAAVTINESADPDVRKDILDFLNGRVPRDGSYKHIEGNSDAHIKSSALGAGLTVIVKEADLVLGTWQGIYFCEFDGSRERQVLVEVMSR